MKIVRLSKGQARWWPVIGTIRGTDQETWHAYDWSASWVYRDLVREMARHLFKPGTRYLFQAEPNLRIQRPGDVAVPWHSDRDFGHHPAEQNVWIPLHELVDDSQRVWFEDDQGHPYCPTVDLGQALVFPGAIMEHGNQLNTCGIERRSFDFRMIRAQDWTDRGHRTVNYGVPMSIGSYWRTSLVPA